MCLSSTCVPHSRQHRFTCASAKPRRYVRLDPRSRWYNMAYSSNCQTAPVSHEGCNAADKQLAGGVSSVVLQDARCPTQDRTAQAMSCFQGPAQRWPHVMGYATRTQLSCDTNHMHDAPPHGCCSWSFPAKLQTDRRLTHAPPPPSS